MSFRGRLTLFFVLIVVVPMLVGAVVIERLVATSRVGRVDARLDAGRNAAATLYAELGRRADAPLRRLGRDPALGRAVRAGRPAEAAARAAALRGPAGLARVALLRGERTVLAVGDGSAVAPSRLALVDARRQALGVLQGATVRARDYAALVRRQLGLEVVVHQGARTLASTREGLGATRAGARAQDITLPAGRFRSAGFSAPGVAGGELQVLLLAPAVHHQVGRARLLIGAAVAGFLLLAVALALVVSRALESQVHRFLDAARRLGSGNFSEPVPIEGSDGFAELGGEFNKMSRELEARLLELRAERARLAEAIKRIGRTAAANLDADALLELVTQTAVDAADAASGRASARTTLDAPPSERVVVGALDGHAGALRAAEELARDARGPVGAQEDGVFALAHGLRPRDADRDRLLGTIAVTRRERPFSPEERELFGDLCAQAALSLENLLLNQQVRRQAVTDELTGLANHRRFQEVISSEVERTRRYGQSLGLVMLDLDNFKGVNDAFGHQQGDLVLREVARIVRESAREVDVAARYGGEELAVTLPGTDLEGAFNAAERLRRGLEELAIPRLDGQGPLRVTASFGVAALPESGADKASLIAAADAALYRAKRGGRNRTERAEPFAAAVGARAPAR